MKRLLIIAPHFAPVAAPDGQRVRLLLPHLEELGWKATVLTVEAAEVAAPREEALLATLPADADIRRVRAWPLANCRRFGLGNLGWRALTALWREGSRLLRAEKFDLVYFSTTQFAVLPLGRLWLRRFGVPYVIDLQDPWRNDYYARSGHRPPGGWKYRFASLHAAGIEAWTLRRCVHVVSVSPNYLTQLANRYPWFDPHTRGTVIPFGWSENDLAAARHVARVKTGSAPDALRRIVYMGRVGEDMLLALSALFEGFSIWRASAPSARPIRFIFAGTTYAPTAGANSVVARAATAAGVSDAVEERPGRIGYLESLSHLLSADANLLLGSDDPAYSPSKLWPTLAAARPWIAVLPKPGVLETLIAPFASSGAVISLSDRAVAAQDIASWFDRLSQGSVDSVPVDSSRLQSYEAATLAHTHARIFANGCLPPPAFSG